MSDESLLGERGYAPPPVTGGPSPSAGRSLASAISAGADRVILPDPRQVFEQGKVESCVSCSLTSALESRHGASGPALAAVFHYYVARFDRGLTDAAGRLTFSAGLDVLAGAGICRSSAHPQAFDDAGIRVKPSQAARADALTRRFQRNHQLRLPFEHIGPTARATSIRDHIKRRNPVVIGFKLPTGYPHGFLDATGVWADPGVAPAGGGHAVAVVGFDDALRAFRIWDSQGSVFAGGDWWMGYRVVDSSFVYDAYALT